MRKVNGDQVGIHNWHLMLLHRSEPIRGTFDRQWIKLIFENLFSRCYARNMCVAIPLTESHWFVLSLKGEIYLPGFRVG